MSAPLTNYARDARIARIARQHAELILGHVERENRYQFSDVIAGAEVVALETAIREALCRCDARWVAEQRNAEIAADWEQQRGKVGQ